MIKELDDYLDILESKYPHISRAEIKGVIEHGFYTFHLLNKCGADIEIHKNRKYTAYCGKMYLDNHTRALYNSAKARKKLRLKYKYAQEEYDGAYYFGLTNEEWESCQKQITSKKQKKIKFTNILLFKIREESFLDKSKTHFFMVNYPIDVGWTFTKDEFTTYYKYIAYRDENKNIIMI